MGLTLEKFNALRDLWHHVLDHKEEILTNAVNAVLKEYTERIFDYGEASDNSQIGVYSVEPIRKRKNRMVNPRAKTDQLNLNEPRSVKWLYIKLQRYQERIDNLKQKIYFSKEGTKTKQELEKRLNLLIQKRNRLEKTTLIALPRKKNPKTIYFLGGYKQFRGVQGLKNDKVYLQYSGYFRKSFRVRFGNSGAEILLANDPNLRKPPGVKDPPDVVELAEHFEKQYDNTIFQPSEEEKQLCDKLIAYGIVKELKKYAQGKDIQILSSLQNPDLS